MPSWKTSRIRRVVPAREIIAEEITDDLEAGLEQFASIAEDSKP